MDATYKLLEIRTPVYVFHNEDLNGATEVVCVALLVREDRETFEWMFHKFKDLNPASKSTKCVMTDKDILERDVIKRTFPDANLLICVFHTLRTFAREVTTTKLSITAEERESCLHLLQKMVTAKSDAQFDALQEEFDDVAPQSFQQYYDKNWRGIKNEWYTGPQFQVSSFNNTTNNRLECLNAKLKSVVKRNSSLEDFVKLLFATLKAVSDEHDHKEAMCIYKRPAEAEAMAAAQKYCQHVTPYAFQHLRDQLDRVDGVHVVENVGDIFRCKPSHGEMITTVSSCSCPFWVTMKLPCRHILAVRATSGVDPYNEGLVDKRWTTAYYRSNQRIFQGQDEEYTSPPCSVTMTVQISPKVLSQQQKFRKAFLTCQRIAQLAAEATRGSYYERIEPLENLVKAWEGGMDVCIVEKLQDTPGCTPPDQELLHQPDVMGPENMSVRRLGGICFVACKPQHRHHGGICFVACNPQHIPDKLWEVCRCHSWPFTTRHE